jgi:hypothetical protein
MVAGLRSVVSIETVHWDINFIRFVHDWEVSFFNVLYSARVGREGEDRLCWTSSKRRSFEVKSFYKFLLPNVDSPFPWKIKAPLRLAFFTQIASLGKIITLDNICKCHIVVID